ncbi:hypothetical protein NC99_45140 [Sunxiuqinia dokdonensis]|uniref:Uncharacterized protein n=1 Tax=Sunxiuqinia dokdonensis TaxID=1409788 RepID=A0A0L8V2U6_9BACT|nr:hypothetical protein NC99_45140 [Sunxiuqinia dokdonensis]
MSNEQSKKPASTPHPKPVKPQRPTNTIEKGIKSGEISTKRDNRS